MNINKISILGGGNLGSSIATGLLNAKVVEPGNLTLTRRRLHMIEDFKKLGVKILSDNVAAIKEADLIILAVKPHQVFPILEEISSSVNADKQAVVSVITGVTIEQLQNALPKVPVVRAMPNTAVALNESMTCIAGNGNYKETEIVVEELFSKLGKAILINEELMGSATVIGACGVAFALRFMRAMSQGGIEIGFGAEVSQQITAQTIKGAAKLILESDNHPEKEIDRVTTPMGVTISGLNEMEHQGFSSSVIKGLLTSFNKLEHLPGKNS